MSVELTAAFLGLLAATLLLGQSWSRIPLSQLGKRPMGRELWGWLFHSAGTGVWGYDSSLGCWSPPIRLMIHNSVCGILYSMFGEVSVIVYLLWCFYNHHLVPNVSHPGGPRLHKIQRIPQFHDKAIALDEVERKKWRAVVADESHEDTEQKFAGESLSGEPVGRQMWTTASKSKKRVDEKLVQQLAAGGRDPGTFNAAKNPNRYVQYTSGCGMLCMLTEQVAYTSLDVTLPYCAPQMLLRPSVVI